MSIQDERQLKVRLGSALDGIEPGPAPLAAVVRQGRGIKQRRRAMVAGGVAVVAAAAVVGPTVVRSELSAPPVAPAPHYTVTVSPPARGAKPGVIATGSINGWHWRVTLFGTGSNVSGDFGSSFGYFQIGTQVPLGGEFASFDSEGRGTGPAGRIAYLGPAAAAVRYLTVSLQNGQTLTLYPQLWEGHRYVAMILPAEMRVEEAVAYGAHGELGYAIPYDYAGAASFGAWLQPGQTGRAEATARIASGGSGSGRWTAIAYVGPWGLCMRAAVFGGGFCQAILPASQTALVKGEYGSGPGGLEVGLARQDVAYLLVTKSDGSVIRLTAVRVAGLPYRLLGTIRPRLLAFTSWVAYDARGRRLGSGSGDPLNLP